MELTNSITSGEIIPFIQESWWLIIERLDINSKIGVNGITVEVPANIKNALRIYELQNPETYTTYYKVKYFGLHVF